jgi:hypothetical protein
VKLHKILPALLPTLLLCGCAGPRMMRMEGADYKPLDSRAPVDVYVGQLDPPYAEIAVIDSEAFAFIDDAAKQRQIEELQARARQLGANALQDVRILGKDVRGFTTDEQTPFTSWKQGEYTLYFMRAMAVRVPEREPASIHQLNPIGGWVVDRYAPPPRLGSATSATTLPGPRDTPPASAGATAQP